MTGHSTTRSVLALIAVATLVRVAMAFALGLGIDESYMLAAGRGWHWGYFDHPPLAWWMSHGMASLAGSEAAWVVRLPFIALFAATTWLMYRLTAALFTPQAGLWAAVAATLSPVFGLTSAGWVLPDGPLDFSLVAAALALVRALDGGAWRWWLVAGAAAGLALLSKYSAGLILAGAALYLLLSPAHRRWLARPQPYVAALLALALFAPVLVWNAGHGWASFAFQGGRAGMERFNPLGPLSVLAGEAAFVLPWIWAGLLLALFGALRAGPRHWRTFLPACLGILPIVLFVLVGLWSRHVLFHWAAPGYLMLFPLLGAALERWHARWPRAIGRTAWGTAGLLVLLLAAAGTALHWNVLPFPPGRDPAVQALDWTGLPEALAARGIAPGTPVAATGWQEAGKIGYALGPDWPVLCLNRDAREFGLTSNLALRPGKLLILGTRAVDAAWLAEQGFRFASVTAQPPVVLALPGGRTLTLQAALAESGG